MANTAVTITYAVLHVSRKKLSGSDEMNGNANVGEVDQPKRLVETEPGKEIPGSIVPKCSVAKAAAHDIE
nr:Os11g0195650 [Ipomoea batatas]